MILNQSKLSKNISLRVNSDIDSNKVLGANVYVAQNGRVLFNLSFGYKTVDKQIKLKANNVFRLASMTKPIIVFAILKLIEKGKLDIFDRADKYIRGFNGFYVGKLENDVVIPVKKAVNPIRILDLLTHSSGLGSGEIWSKESSRMTINDKKDLSSAVEFYKTTCLAFEPYCGNAYSPTAAFDVLAQIVENISEKSIEDFLKEELFIPLEMSDTTFFPNDDQWNRVVDMHNLVNGESVSVDMHGSIFSNNPIGYTCGGAGLVSTVSDYSKFTEMLLNNGSYNGKNILSCSLVNSMRISHILEQYACADVTWGLGVRVVKDGNVLPKDCFGWSGAYGTHFWIDPTNKIIAIYMKNSFYDGGSDALTARHFEQDVMSSI